MPNPGASLTALPSSSGLAVGGMIPQNQSSIGFSNRSAVTDSLYQTMGAGPSGAGTLAVPNSAPGQASLQRSSDIGRISSSFLKGI